MMQILNMSTTIQRILRHLRLPDEPIANTYAKFAETFKIEVSERWHAKQVMRRGARYLQSSGPGSHPGGMGPNNRGGHHG